METQRPPALARVRPDAAGNKRNECHVVRVDASRERLNALCGEWIRPDQAEWRDALGEQPCVACQLLTGEPDPATLEWAASLPGLERRP